MADKSDLDDRRRSCTSLVIRVLPVLLILNRKKRRKVDLTLIVATLYLLAIAVVFGDSVKAVDGVGMLSYDSERAHFLAGESYLRIRTVPLHIDVVSVTEYDGHRRSVSASKGRESEMYRYEIKTRFRT